VIHSAPRTPALVDFNLNEEEHRPSDPKMSCGGRVRILVEPLANPHQLCIVGGGHCGSELSRLAASVGYSVTVIDNRETWAGRDKHPAASRVICAPYDEIEHHIPFSNEICIAVMTHGHAHDEEIARRCLKHEFRYLGVIGSSRKAAGLFKRLREDGFDEHQLSRLHCPIGLPIPSHTPAEIAVSIVAQLLTIREEPAGGTALDSPPNPA